jgi:hypothetical protein
MNVTAMHIVVNATGGPNRDRVASTEQSTFMSVAGKCNILGQDQLKAPRLSFHTLCLQHCPS